MPSKKKNSRSAKSSPRKPRYVELTGRKIILRETDEINSRSHPKRLQARLGAGAGWVPVGDPVIGWTGRRLDNCYPDFYFRRNVSGKGGAK